MDRRGFLGFLTAGIAGLVVGAEVDLERLLWVPKPMITVPALPGGNQFVTPDWVIAEYARVLEHNARLAYTINRDYDRTGVVGDMLTVRMPQRYDVHPTVAKDAERGIAIRMMKEWDLTESKGGLIIHE